MSSPSQRGAGGRAASRIGPWSGGAVAQADGPATVVPLHQHRRSAWPKVLGWGVAAAAAAVLGSAVLPSLLSVGASSSTSAGAPERVNSDSGGPGACDARLARWWVRSFKSEVDSVPWTGTTWLTRLDAKPTGGCGQGLSTTYAAAAGHPWRACRRWPLGFARGPAGLRPV